MFLWLHINYKILSLTKRSSPPFTNIYTGHLLCAKYCARHGSENAYLKGGSSTHWTESRFPSLIDFVHLRSAVLSEYKMWFDFFKVNLHEKLRHTSAMYRWVPNLYTWKWEWFSCELAKKHLLSYVSWLHVRQLGSVHVRVFLFHSHDSSLS